MGYLKEYLKLYKELVESQEKNHGKESDEEDKLLDEMDILWYKLSNEEVLYICSLSNAEMEDGK